MTDKIRTTGVEKTSKKFKGTCIAVSLVSVAVSIFLGLAVFTLQKQNDSISDKINDFHQQINYFENQNDKVSDKYKNQK